MANTSILAAFERMWQHVINVVSNKADKSDLVPSDWNQNDESAIDYVKNRTHYMGMVNQELIAEQEIENTTSGNNAITILGECPITEKSVFYITMDGITYVSNNPYYYESIPAWYFGGISVDDSGQFSIDYTVCPLIGFVQIMAESYITMIVTEDGGSHTVSITMDVEKAIPLDEKYIPDSVKAKPDWNQNDENASDYVKNRTHYTETWSGTVLEDTTYDFSTQTTVTLPAAFDNLVPGGVYTVNFNGTEYVCTAEEQVVGGGVYRLGTIIGFESSIANNEPFSILSVYESMQNMMGSAGYIKVNETVGNVVLSIDGTYDVVHKLDDKYLDLNILDGSAKGSVRTSNATKESADYKMGNSAFAEGFSTKASGNYSHAEGAQSVASGEASHAEGGNSIASGSAAHAEGGSTASGQYSHSEGNQSVAEGRGSHAEGYSNYAVGEYSHAEGGWLMNETTTGGYTVSSSNFSGITEEIKVYGSTSYGIQSHAEGANTLAFGFSAHSEGYETKAYGHSTHTEGYNTVASGDYAHAEGVGTKATVYAAHAEGNGTTASGQASHAEGNNSVASGNYSHAEGRSTASGVAAHAEGWYTIAAGEYQHVEGKRNIEDTENKYAHIVGNGESTSARSNAHTLDWSGNAWFAGDVYVGGTSQDDAGRLLCNSDFVVTGSASSATLTINLD